MSSLTTNSSDVDDRFLFPRCEEDWELDVVAVDEAFRNLNYVLGRHPGNKCLPSMEVPPGHCLVCEYHTGDPFFVWHQLLIINKGG
jgi:hypothetical protein